MEQLNNLDVVFLVIVGVSALVALARGCTKELLSITGWVLAGFAVYFMLPIFSPIAQKYIESKILSDLVASMGILLFFCILWLLLADKLNSKIRLSKFSALDRLLGVIFGVARGVIIVILIQIFIAGIIPDEANKGIFAESRYFKMAGDSAGPIKSLIPQKWFDDLKEKSLAWGLADDENEEAKTAQKDGENADEPKTVKEIATEALAKNSEELFNQLVQPMPKGENSEDELEITEDDINEAANALKEGSEALFNKLVQPLPKTEKAEETSEAEEVAVDMNEMLGE